MSILNLKWVKGAPAMLLPGMVIRVQGEVLLVGHYSLPAMPVGLADIEEHAQAISGYELDWLENMGLPAKAVA